MILQTNCVEVYATAFGSGKELFAFRWVSKRFGCNAYLKFALKEDNFYLVSLHQHRQKKGGAHEKGD
jgi:hypothetical protein